MAKSETTAHGSERAGSFSELVTLRSSALTLNQREFISTADTCCGRIILFVNALTPYVRHFLAPPFGVAEVRIPPDTTTQCLVDCLDREFDRGYTLPMPRGRVIREKPSS